MKKILNIIPYILIVLFVILVREYIVTPVRVDGDSMEPTLLNNELVILNKLEYKLNDIDRFDVVVINYGDSALVKRVIGLPGETVEYSNNQLYINGEKVSEDFIFETTDDFRLIDINESAIPNDMYFVMGDNRDNSTDSRIIGLIPEKNILGEAWVIIYPFNKVGRVE